MKVKAELIKSVPTCPREYRKYVGRGLGEGVHGA